MIRSFKGQAPRVAATAYVDVSAQVIGDVELGADASVWMNAVVRGDVGPIRIGARTSVQDLTVVHCTRGKHFATLGADVTVGHSVTLHGCTVRDRVLVGMAATIMDGAVIEEDSIVGAGALVTPGATFPPRSLIVGAPARVKRPLTDEEVASILQSARNYVEYTREHREDDRACGASS